MPIQTQPDILQELQQLCDGDNASRRRGRRAKNALLPPPNTLCTSPGPRGELLPGEKRVLTVDPSSKALGWALFGHTTRECWLIAASVIQLRGQPAANTTGRGKRPSILDDEDWVTRSDVMADQIHTLAQNNTPSTVLIELPEEFQSSKGLAALNSGSITKLMFTVATIRTRLLHSPHSRIHLVPVRKWKGSTPKSITQRRVARHWGVRGDHNMIDAIGIGDWYLRKFLRIGRIVPAPAN